MYGTLESDQQNSRRTAVLRRIFMEQDKWAEKGLKKVYKKIYYCNWIYSMCKLYILFNICYNYILLDMFVYA